MKKLYQLKKVELYSNKEDQYDDRVHKSTVIFYWIELESAILLANMKSRESKGNFRKEERKDWVT